MFKNLTLITATSLAVIGLSGAADAGLIAEWNLNEGSGTTTALTGGSLKTTDPGTASDDFSTATGVTWGAAGTSPGSTASLTFTGDNAVNTLNTNVSGSGLSGTGAKTFVGWINPTNHTGSVVSYSPRGGEDNGEDLRMLLDTDGKLRAEVNGGFFKAGATVSSLVDGGWVMVAAIFDTNTNSSSLYISGLGILTDYSRSATNRAIDTASTLKGTAPNANINFIIGSDPASRGFTGGIDKVQVYNEALTESQLDALLIPEPASLALMGLGGLLMLGRTRRG